MTLLVFRRARTKPSDRSESAGPPGPSPGRQRVRPLLRLVRAGLAKKTLSGAAFVMAVTAATAQWAPAPASADQPPVGPPPAQTFYYTGSIKQVTVPAGVNTAVVKVIGGHGGNADADSGDGAQVTARLPVSPGQLLSVYVGAQGGNANVPHYDPPAGGWGFSPGGSGGAGSGGRDGAGGGGSSAIYRVSPRASYLVVAGGGGGAAGFGALPGVDAAGAGGSSGATIDPGHDGKGPGSGNGGAGAGNSAPIGGQGTAGQAWTSGGGGGGGGAGYLGGLGGGGGKLGGGGGGGGGAGSSYVTPDADQVSVTRASGYGNGEVDVSWEMLSKCANQTVQAPGNQRGVTVQLQCSPTDGEGFYQVLHLPDHGYLDNRDFANGTFDYVPQPGYTGSDSMTFDYEAPGWVSGPATVTFNVVPAPRPSMVLSASSAQVVEGQAPVFSVRMPIDVTGDVGFYNTSLPGQDKGMGLAEVVNGVATLDTPTRPLLLGDNRIQASFGGDGTYAANDSNAVIVTMVAKPKPSMALSASSTRVVEGQPPVFNVDMPADVTGEVGFYNSALPGQDKGIGVAQIVNGVATLETPTRPLLAGDNQIQAFYGGDAVYAANGSNEVTVTVDAAQP